LIDAIEKWADGRHSLLDFIAALNRNSYTGYLAQEISG
jgi:hypothetical protein